MQQLQLSTCLCRQNCILHVHNATPEYWSTLMTVILSNRTLKTNPTIFKRVVFNFSHHWVDTSAGGLLVPEGIISSVVSTSVLTWFNKPFSNCPFMNFEIIKKLRFQLPQEKLTLDEFGFYFRYFWHLAPQRFRYLYIHGFQIFGFERSWWRLI